MNAIGMIFPQMQLPNEMHGKTKGQNTLGFQAGFQALLNSEQDTEAPLMEGLPAVNEVANKMPDEQWLMVNELLGRFQPNINDELQENDPVNNEAFQMTSADMVENDTGNQMQEALVEEEVDQELKADPYERQIRLGIEVESVKIFSELESIISQIKSKEDIEKAAPKILADLEKWSALEERSGNVKGMNNTLTLLENEDTRESKVWKDLIQTYQRREQLASTHKYNIDANVTTADVSKWIGKAMDEHLPLDRVTGNNAISFSSLPQSKLEQYVIHMNQTQESGARAADQQLIEQFQKVMKSSRFLVKPNGINQLSIALRPHNLGEMMVRLTQINGEMTVKIIVTSHAAKEMLDSNMHQLRSMFSPQQVVVEKQDVNMQQGQDVQKEQKDQQLNDHEQNQSQHSDQQENAQADDDFESRFHELLMNEKV